MDINRACETVRQWELVFTPGAPMRAAPGCLPGAVQEVKRYLEKENGDGQSITELEIAEHLLMTREGVRWVMPFVMSAESLEESHRRGRASQY